VVGPVIAAGLGSVGVARWDARAIGYRSLRAPLPEAVGRGWPLGWELYLDLEGDRSRALTAAAKAGWGLLLSLAERDDLADHLLLAVGAAGQSRRPSAAAPSRAIGPGVSVPLALEARASLGRTPALRYRSWLGARLSIEPVAALAGVRRRLGVEA